MNNQAALFLLAGGRSPTRDNLAQSPQPNAGKADSEITIAICSRKMTYDTESFSVKPKSKVKLTLKNPDVMRTILSSASLPKMQVSASRNWHGHWERTR